MPAKNAPLIVLWLPSHPAMGAASMDRYWQELDQTNRREGAPAGWRITSPLGLPPAETRRRGRFERAWHKYIGYPLAVRRAARARGVRVVHVLDHSFAHLLKSVPSRGVFRVATVHDLAPLRDGADLTEAQRARFRRTVENLRLADVVLAVSRYSADEAISLLGLAADRVKVLPEGVNVEHFAQGTNEGESPVPEWRQALGQRRVVLSVGTTGSRKNLQILPAVFRALRDGAPDGKVALLRVGQPLPDALRAELRATLGESGVVELGLAPEAVLVAAYQHADALIFPSLIEGFGFPVLEAMAAGCPVVCTHVTSLPEVGGEAALYFSPDDPAAAAGHLQRLFADETFRREQVRRGREQAARFSWTEHYRKLLEIYGEAV